MKTVEEIIGAEFYKNLGVAYDISKNILDTFEEIDSLAEPDIKQTTVLAACAKFGSIDPFFTVFSSQILLSYVSIMEKKIDTNEKIFMMQHMHRVLLSCMSISHLQSVDINVKDFIITAMNLLSVYKIHGLEKATIGMSKQIFNLLINSVEIFLYKLNDMKKEWESKQK